MFQDLSIEQNPARGRSKFFVQVWWIFQSVFVNTSPQVMYGWRRFCLRLFGAKIGKNVLIRPSVKVTYPWNLCIGDFSQVGDDVVLYTLDKISIGSHSVVSQRSYICTGSHDTRSLGFELITSPIVIGNEVWISFGCFVAPGVRLGDGCWCKAGSMVTSSFGDASILAGSPATTIGQRLAP